MANIIEGKPEQDSGLSILLHQAVVEDNLDVARFLLKHGMCPDGRATLKQLSLDGFPTNGEHRRFLRWRLGAGAEVAVAEAMDGKSCTALHLAARGPDVQAVDLLLRHGAEVNAAMEGGETPLLIAVLMSAHDVVELLLTRGADVNARTNWGKSILHYAAKTGNGRALELLLAKGGHVNTADVEGKTALHIAAEAGNMEIVEILLNYSADVSLRAKSGATALHFAAIKGNLEVVELMVNHGADINLIMRHGGIDLTPFKSVTAAEERKTMEIVAKYNTKTRLVNWYNTVMSKFKSSAKDKKSLFCAEAE